MAKRFTATEIWDEDWFLEMPNEYKLFWYYMLSKCDHAGLFKVNERTFNRLIEVNLTSNSALIYFNRGKDRVKVISDSVWYVEDFFVYQYGTTFNWNNRVHESIGELYKRQNIDPKKIRGLLDLKEGVKDKDKDKDKNNNKSEKKIDKNILGKEFTPDGQFVILETGEKQELGKSQKILAMNQSIMPQEIYKNYIV